MKNYHTVRRKNNKKRIQWLVFGIVVILALLLVINHASIYEQIRAMTYHPSEKMKQIRDLLELTDKGRYYFNVAQPMLSGRGEFNAHCRTDEKNESAVLGCYTDGSIYVFDIESKELDGIRELTTAHELLHANWARLDESDKKRLESSLKQVYETNKDILEKELATYDEVERQEELYVRAGTEVEKLPADLEKHFGEIFKNQDKIVKYYNKYISVFRQLESDMKELKKELDALQSDIDAKRTEYDTRVAELNSRVTEFNNCANTAGCFNSQWAFNNQRNELLGEQSNLESLFNDISSMIDTYNAKATQYNEFVIYSEKLNNMVNSSAVPAEIE